MSRDRTRHTCIVKIANLHSGIIAIFKRNIVVFASSIDLFDWLFHDLYLYKTNNFDSKITPPTFQWSLQGRESWSLQRKLLRNSRMWWNLLPATWNETYFQHYFRLMFAINRDYRDYNVDCDENLAWAGNSSPIRTQGTGPSPRVKAKVKMRRRTFQCLHHFEGNMYIYELTLKETGIWSLAKCWS